MTMIPVYAYLQKMLENTLACMQAAGSDVSLQINTTKQHHVGTNSYRAAQHTRG